MEKNIYYKFWIDKEFDAKLYDEALKEKPNIKNFNACMLYYNGELFPKEKYLERLYDIIIYYADKGIFLEDNDFDYCYTNLCIMCKDIIRLNKNIDYKKYDYKKIDPVNIIDIMYERGYKPSLSTIYKLYFDSNIFNKDINLKERYDLKETDTIEHLELANEYGKIIISSNFSLEVFEDFCLGKMKESIVKKILKYLEPDINCLECACYENNITILNLLLNSNKKLKFNMECLENSLRYNKKFEIVLYIINSNKELKFNMKCLENACCEMCPNSIKEILKLNKKLKFNMKCLENSIMYNKDIGVAQLIFPDIKKIYGEIGKIKKDLVINIKQNLDNPEPIEKKLIKKIEKK